MQKKIIKLEKELRALKEENCSLEGYVMDLKTVNDHLMDKQKVHESELFKLQNDLDL